MSLQTPPTVRKRQRALYAKAKEAPEYRFYQLYDKVYRTDMLRHAYDRSKANDGTAGVDGQGFSDIEAYGQPEQYGYRPKRSAQDAVREVHRLIQAGHREEIDGDLSGYFDSIPHGDLMKSVSRRISDR